MNARPTLSKASLKDLLGELPLVPEVYWSLRQPGKPVTAKFALDRLQEAIWVVVDQKVAQRLVHLPEDLRLMWPKLAYTQFSADNSMALEEILTLLQHPVLSIRQKHQMKKALSSLKVLLRTISGIEEQANRVIYSLKNGEQTEMHL